MVAEWERHLELVIARLLLLLVEVAVVAGVAVELLAVVEPVEVAVHDAAVGLHHGPAGAGAGPRLAEPDVEGGGGEAGGLLHGGLGPHHALLRSAAGTEEVNSGS